MSYSLSDLEFIALLVNWSGHTENLTGKNTGLRIPEEYLSHLRFTDEIVLLSETAEHLQKMFEELLSESTATGLRINIYKSKVIRNNHAESALFSSRNETLQEVKGYNVLPRIDV